MGTAISFMKWMYGNKIAEEHTDHENKKNS